MLLDDAGRRLNQPRFQLISVLTIFSRGTYGRYKPAHSMEPLPIRMMTRASTRQRNSRPVLLTDFCHDFQVMNAHCHYGFSQEYEVMVKVGRKLSSNAAVLAANVSKNRYTNILPCKSSFFWFCLNKGTRSNQFAVEIATIVIIKW